MRFRSPIFPLLFILAIFPFLQSIAGIEETPKSGNENDTLVDRSSGRDILKAFVDKGIDQISFAKGSSGCFHNYGDVITYQLSGAYFRETSHKAIGSSHAEMLPDNESEFDEGLVREFTDGIPNLLDQTLHIKDIQISEEDLAACRRDVNQFKRLVLKEKPDAYERSRFWMATKNVDFDRLLRLVDSIPYASRKDLTNLLDDSLMVISTTSKWTKITLINRQGEKMMLSAIDYAPHSYNLSWRLSIDSFHKSVESPIINDFLGNVYPSLVAEQDKISILHTILRSLYRQSQ